MSALQEKMNIKLFNPENIKLSLDGEQELIVELKNEEKVYENVEVSPAFPLSQIGKYISLKKSKKSKKKSEKSNGEIGMIENISKLDGESREALENILEKMYFMPRIIKILDVNEEYRYTRWEVETEKGFRSFQIKSRRRDIRPYDNGRVIFHDVDGNRYEITDYKKLDKNSLKLLRSEI